MLLLIAVVINVDTSLKNNVAMIVMCSEQRLHHKFLLLRWKINKSEGGDIIGFVSLVINKKKKKEPKKKLEPLPHEWVT